MSGASWIARGLAGALALALASEPVHSSPNAAAFATVSSSARSLSIARSLRVVQGAAIARGLAKAGLGLPERSATSAAGAATSDAVRTIEAPAPIGTATTTDAAMTTGASQPPALGSTASTTAPEAAAHAPRRVAITGAKLLTMDDENRVFSPGMVIAEDGRITYVGTPIEPPAGAERIDAGDGWLIPGLVDLHTHIHGNGYNDMVRAVNPELRASPDVRAHNWFIQRGCASGVTTLFGIPGSGTNIGGFGILYKARTHGGFEKTVIADPGGMKVAQDSNPQRRNAADFGISRAGQTWNITDVNDRAVAALEQGRKDPALEWLKRVHAKELPVLIHTAGSEGVVNTARTWRVTYDTRSVLSHGSFDGWMSAPALAEIGIPVNHGPRTMDYYSSRNGRINGSAAEYSKVMGENFSLNTDSGVVRQEEFFLQGAMGTRYGGDAYQMLRAMTIHPAKAFGIDARVGSLEVGKDADIVVRAGDPLDPRTPVELVLIEGDIQYERAEDGQWF